MNKYLREIFGALDGLDRGPMWNKYLREIFGALDGLDRGPMWVDVYAVLDAFKVTNPDVQHAVKKLLCPGQRGVKSTLDDLREAYASLGRAIEIERLNTTGPTASKLIEATATEMKRDIIAELYTPGPCDICGKPNCENPNGKH